MSKVSITTTLEELEVKIAECRQKALLLIQDSKRPNPKINVLCNKPRMFTISSRDLSSDLVLSPEFYDYEWQFDFLICKLEKQNLDTFRNTLLKIVETGKCDGNRFHPDVIKLLKEMV